MTKVKVEKYLVISFIGLILIFFAGFGGNIALKAGLPASVSKTGINFEKRLHLLEEDLLAGKISRTEYDSLTDLIHLQIQSNAALQDEKQILDKMPDWVRQTGIIEPEKLKFDPVFSNFTSVDDPTEGFNSVSLVYSGTYEDAIADAAKIAASARLSSALSFKAKGSPVQKHTQVTNQEVSYLNYNLEKSDPDFLISVQVEPSGRLTIMVTDNKQLTEKLLTYEPLNNRQKSDVKRKKL